MDVDHLAARPLLEESLELLHDLDDQDSIIGVTRTLAFGHLELGDWKHAQTLYAENLARARQLDNRLQESHALGALALIAADRGQQEEALQLARDKLLISGSLGRLALASAFSGIAYVLAHVGRTTGAVQILACAEALHEEIGASEPWVVRQNEQIRVFTREHLGEAASADAYRQGRTLTVDEAFEFALEVLS